MLVETVHVLALFAWCFVRSVVVVLLFLQKTWFAKNQLTTVNQEIVRAGTTTTTSAPPPAAAAKLKLKFYINVNYTAFLQNYTADVIISEWQKRFTKVDYSKTLNTSLSLALSLSPMNVTPIYKLWQPAIITDTESYRNFSQETLVALTEAWDIPDGTDYTALSVETVAKVANDWRQGKLALIADKLLKRFDMSLLNKSHLAMVDYLAGHPNVTSMVANVTSYNISKITAASFIVSLAANKLNGSVPEVYIGVIGLTFRKLAAKQGITSGYNYTSFLRSIIQAVAKWPSVHNQSDALSENFTKAAIAKNWEKQFGDCVQSLDSGYTAGLNFTLFAVSSEPPVFVPLVNVVDIEFQVTGKYDPAALLQLIRYQNLKQNITNTVAGTKRTMWLIEDINVADHSQIPTVACLASLTNCIMALGTLFYFTRKLHHSERYQQVPILDEDDEEIN